MIRAWVRVDPDTQDVLSYNECDVAPDPETSKLPELAPIDEFGYLQFEVDPFAEGDDFEIDWENKRAFRLVSKPKEGEISDLSDHETLGHQFLIAARMAMSRELLS